MRSYSGAKAATKGVKKVRKGGIEVVEVRKTAVVDPFLVTYPRILYVYSVAGVFMPGRTAADKFRIISFLSSSFVLQLIK